MRVELAVVPFALVILGCASAAAPDPGGTGGDAALADGPVGPPLADAGNVDAFGSKPTADAGTPPTGGGPPAACAPAGSIAGLEVITCIPEGMEGKTAEPRPLVLVLHGYTQSAASLLAATQWDVLAGAYGFYVAFPQTSAAARAWYWYTAGRSRGQADPAALVAVVDAMRAAHHIDEARIFVSGMSAGGYMAVNLLADYPEVFAAGAATSGGPHGCGILCPSSPTAHAAALVHAENPSVWNDASARKPRLMVLHGDLDQTNVPGNSDQLVAQWVAAVGAAPQPANAQLGVPTELKGYPYAVYARDGQVAVAHVRLTDLGHGTPVDPGPAPDQGGWDEKPSKTADACYTCTQDWTNTGDLYGAYYEARFYGLIP